MRRYKILTVAAMAWLLVWCGLSAQAQEEVPYGFVQSDRGVMWMQMDGTWAVDCWLHVDDGRVYHTDGNGYIQTGLTRIKGKDYYLYPEGALAKGWTEIDNSWYFFNFDGTLAVNTVVDGLYLGNDGKIIPGQNPVPPQKSELREVVDSILASIIEPEMTEVDKIAACYWYMVDSHTYKRIPGIPAGDWTQDLALEILTTGEGNCFCFAAGYAYLLKGLGYETKVITGEVSARRGGTTPHGWTEVMIGGEWYLFDTELQYANREKDYYWKTYETYPSKPLIKQQEYPVSF